MSIYRGTGGASSVSGSATVEEVLQASVEAQAAAAAASVSATEAASSESASSTSETNAATSETNAASSETNAASSASASATSATASAASAAAALVSETAAAISETNSANSATAAAASAASITDEEANSAASAAAAAASEAAAATSETNASTSETNAAASASAASTSATNAATSATASASSATAAASSASAAAASESVVVAKEALVSPHYDNIDAVGADIANVNTVATNLTDINAFSETYFISGTAPTTPTEGDLWFDTSTDIMKVYNGSAWQSAGSSVNGTSERFSYTATEGQTTFAATYDAGFVDVYLNGVKLVVASDFTATNGSSVVLTSPASLNDTVDIVAYGTFAIANTYTKAEADARYLLQSATTTQRFLTVATEGQTDFSATYTPSSLDVFLNGIKLIPSDFVATNGTTVVLNEAAAADDEVEIITYTAFEVADAYTKAEIDATIASVNTEIDTAIASVNTEIDTKLTLAQVQAAALSF